MKKHAIFALYLTMVLAVATPAAADWMTIRTTDGRTQQILTTKPPATGSASGIAVSGATAFYGIAVKTDGVNNVTLNAYDNTAASGTTLVPANTVIQGADGIWTFAWNPPVKCATGIYVSIAVAGGGTASWMVQHDE